MKLRLDLMLGTIAFFALAGASPAQTATELMTRAGGAFNEKRYDEAIEDLTAVISQDPSNTSALRFRGQVYAMKYNQARQAAAQKGDTRVDPEDPTAQAAISDLTEAIKRNGSDAAALQLRAAVYYSMRDFAKAYDDAKKAKAINPVPVANLLAAIEKNLASNFSIDGGGKFSAARRETNAAQKDKLLNESVSLFSKSIELDPTNEHSFSSRAYAYEALKKYENAIADLTESIKLKPDLHLTFYRRGKAYEELKQFDNAIADFRSGIAALRKKGGDIVLPVSDFYVEIGKLLVLKGEYDRAVAEFDAALQIRPRGYIALYERGRAHIAKGEKEKAEADFRKALEIMPRHAGSTEELGKIVVTP